MTGRTTGGLTTAQIKLLAAAVMVLDHLRRFFGGPLWLTLAGRAALPLFLFAGAEACAHTHSPARRLLRLQAAATATTALELALMAAVPSQVSLLPYRAFGALFCAAAYSRVWDLLVQAVQTRRARPALAAVGLACLPLTGVLAGWLAGALDPGPPPARRCRSPPGCCPTWRWPRAAWPLWCWGWGSTCCGARGRGRPRCCWRFRPPC